MYLNSGCGPTSAAMVIRLTVTLDVFKLTEDNAGNTMTYRLTVTLDVFKLGLR